LPVPPNHASACDALIVPALSLVGLFVLLFLAGVYVAALTGLLGFIGGFLFSSRPLYLFAGTAAWQVSTNFLLVAIPLFVLMGELLLRAGISDRFYRAVSLWTGRLPGGLLHSNIAASAIFSAVSGSSVATAATIGSVALPYFKQTKHNERLVLGSLCAGGALGNLIPPGTAFIIYALLSETSITELYLAGVIPGLVLAALFSVWIYIASVRSGYREEPVRMPLRARLAALWDLVPFIALILLVLGTLYAGIATATEAAALGVLGALAFGARRLSWTLILEAAVATTRTTSMIMLILVGAVLLNLTVSVLGIPRALADLVSNLPLDPWVVMALIVVFYVLLGTFMESLSMIVTTLPVILPIVAALGYDLVWFGVILVILVEMAMVSPPDGVVLYAIQGMRAAKYRPGPITDVFLGVIPFLGMIVLMLALLFLFPQIALWLPSTQQ
jgi:C4-dicarboxylate transporter DctM subunit